MTFVVTNNIGIIIIYHGIISFYHFFSSDTTDQRFCQIRSLFCGISIFFLQFISQKSMEYIWCHFMLVFLIIVQHTIKGFIKFLIKVNMLTIITFKFFNSIVLFCDNISGTGIVLLFQSDFIIICVPFPIDYFTHIFR